MRLPIPAWFRQRGIRGRLALWYAVAIPVVIFALAIGARVVLVAALQGALDEGLRDRARSLSAAILAASPGVTGDYDDLVNRMASQSLRSVPLWVRIADSRGKTLGTFGEIPLPLAEALEHQPVVTQREGRFQTLRVADQDALRVFNVPVFDADSGRMVALVQTADSLAPLSAAKFRLWWYTAAIGATGSLITVAVGVFIAHQGYRPLGRILKRVEEIESSNMAAGLQHQPGPPELQRLEESLNSMWRRLDATFSSQQRFVATMSHDLRTPLTALRGQIEVLMMSPSLAPTAAQALERMSNEVNRLIRMTNNLLTAAQFDSSAPLASSAVDLRELMRGVVMDMRGVARHVVLDTDAPLDVVVMGDYDLLKQALVNLVDNALKFTPAGGHVALRLRIDAGEAVVSVVDSGIGISPDRVRQLLESPEHSRLLAHGQRGGSGLGLSIVKRIVGVHHGSLQIESAEHSGTTVTFRLPLLLAVTEPELLDQLA